MSTADIQLSVVFGGQYSFEKLQSDYEQTDILARDYIKNKPDLVNFEAKTVTAETVIFDENPTGELGALKLQYSPDEKTLEFGLADGGKLQMGKEMFDEYVNVDTVPLTNGMIVSTAAIPGNRKGIKRTDFTSLTSIRSIVGMVTVDSIGTNQSGRVTTKGIINDLNTNGWAEGSQLWGNPSVPGGWSGNKPAKPQYAVQIGQVVVASATVGSVELNVAKDVKFSDLADVNGSTNLIDDTDTIPKRDSDGIIREITVADIKADFKTNTDALYEPLLGFTPENTANKGQANGYASLGADGLVPSNQLPSFVDDVLEFANLEAFPVTGEQGKIYVALDTNKTYRWSGSAYIYITSGAVDSVAGKTGVVTLVKADVGLGNVDNTSDVNKPVSTAQQNALDLKIDKTLSSEITTVADNETMAVKASDSIWKRITWANIKATLKTYFETLFVTLTGAQNIAGVKTFTDSPVVPTPVNNTDAANKAYVQSVITVGNDTYQENKLITDARVATLENVINSANINQETTATVTGVDTIALPKTAANTGMQVQMFGDSNLTQNTIGTGRIRSVNSSGLLPSYLYFNGGVLRSNGSTKDEIRKGANGYEKVTRVKEAVNEAAMFTNNDYLGTQAITNEADREFTIDTGYWLKGTGVTIGNGVCAADGTANAGNNLLRKLGLIPLGSCVVCVIGVKTIIAGGIDIFIGGVRAGAAITTTGVHTRYMYNSSVATSFTITNTGTPFNGEIESLSLVNVPRARLTSKIHYTLATPTITPIAHAGLLNSNSNGTTYFEPIIADAGVYASNIAVQLTDYPIASFESIRKYANGTYTELNIATAVIASGGLSFTHPDLVSGDLVMFTYAYNLESIGRSMTLTHYDSRFVIADTANSKVYRWRITSTNGVASIALTEV